MPLRYQRGYLRCVKRKSDPLDEIFFGEKMWETSNTSHCRYRLYR
jgi:hypothetical protein